MLDFIRKGASSWMIKFILGAIVVVFIFWGVGSFRSQRMDVVAKVNGQKIMTEAYQHEYRKTMEQYRKMFGGSIPEKLLKGLNIKEQVLNSLINRVLIEQEAAKMGIRVSNQEVRQAILGVPAFQINGAFNNRAYQAALREAHLTPADFESQVRESLLMEHLRALINAGLTVPETEAREHYLYENQECDISYIKVDSSQCAPEVKYTNDELEQWFKAHKEKYRTAPKIQLSYLLFDTSKITKEVKVSDEEIRQWYEDHKDKYHQKEQRKARHILIRLPKDASDQEIQAKKKEIEEIRARIKNGADFAKVAKEVSQDPGSAQNGGELGFFTKDAMVKPFANAVFSMKKGEISQPVRTRFGWHIILLEDIKPERTIPLNEVKQQIKAKLATQKANAKAWDKANAAYNDIIQMGSLEDYAKANGITLKTTPLFSRNNPPAFIGRNPQILDGMFALSKGELSSLIDVPSGVLIAEVSDKQEPYIPDFKDVKAKVIKDYIAEKSEELCREKAKAMLEEAKKKGLKQVCQDYGCTVRETGFFRRTAPGANGKLPPPVAKAALSLYSGKVYPDSVEQSGRSFYILAFKQDREADLKGFAAKKKELSQKLLAEKQKTAFESWLQHTREKAEIKISANFKP